MMGELRTFANVAKKVGFDGKRPIEIVPSGVSSEGKRPGVRSKGKKNRCVQDAQKSRTDHQTSLSERMLQ